MSSSAKNPKKTAKASARGGTIILGYSIFFVLMLFLVYRYFYKKKKDISEEYFGINVERTAYLQAVNSNPPVEEETLRRLLLRRGMTAVRRLWKLQADRDSIYSLMREGAVGESVWQSFKSAETGIQREIYEIQAEAETFKEGWSDGILKEAVILCQREDTLNTLLKDKEKEEKKKLKSEAATSKATSPIESAISSNTKSSVQIIEEKDDSS
jgi:hypothetical protein